MMIQYSVDLFLIWAGINSVKIKIDVCGFWINNTNPHQKFVVTKKRSSSFLCIIWILQILCFYIEWYYFLNPNTFASLLDSLSAYLLWAGVDLRNAIGAPIPAFPVSCMITDIVLCCKCKVIKDSLPAIYLFVLDIHNLEEVPRIQEIFTFVFIDV